MGETNIILAFLKEALPEANLQVALIRTLK